MSSQGYEVSDRWKVLVPETEQETKVLLKNSYEYRVATAVGSLCRRDTYVIGAPEPRLLSENEWRSLGIHQSTGWEHLGTWAGGQLLFRRPIQVEAIPRFDLHTGVTRKQVIRNIVQEANLTRIKLLIKLILLGTDSLRPIPSGVYTPEEETLAAYEQCYFNLIYYLLPRCVNYQEVMEKYLPPVVCASPEGLVGTRFLKIRKHPLLEGVITSHTNPFTGEVSMHFFHKSQLVSVLATNDLHPYLDVPFGKTALLILREAGEYFLSSGKYHSRLGFLYELEQKYPFANKVPILPGYEKLRFTMIKHLKRLIERSFGERSLKSGYFSKQLGYLANTLAIYDRFYQQLDFPENFTPRNMLLTGAVCLMITVKMHGEIYHLSDLIETLPEVIFALNDATQEKTDFTKVFADPFEITSRPITVQELLGHERNVVSSLSFSLLFPTIDRFLVEFITLDQESPKPVLPRQPFPEEIVTNLLSIEFSWKETPSIVAQALLYLQNSEFPVSGPEVMKCVTRLTGKILPERSYNIRHPDYIDRLALPRVFPRREYKRVSPLNSKQGISVVRPIDQKDSVVAVSKSLHVDDYDCVSDISLNEIGILKELSHPNIVQLLDITGHKLILEKMDSDLNGDMENSPGYLCPSLWRKSEKQQLRSDLYQILVSIEQIHSRGLLHLDVKGYNVLVKKSPGHRIIKLADFGLSVFPRFEKSTNVQTLWYRAPEVILGDPCYTAAVDIWSVGMLMTELLSRRAPLICERSELSQLLKIFFLLGTPEKVGTQQVPSALPVFPRRRLRDSVTTLNYDDPLGWDLLEGLLEVCPEERLTATEALNHPFFHELLMDQS